MLKDFNEVERRFIKKSDAAPRQLRHFNQLDNSLVQILKEGEYATACDEDKNEHLVWVRDGKLFSAVGKEVEIQTSLNELTAGTVQTQAGGLKLTAEINDIDVVANTGDAVVLPKVRSGKVVVIINSGANAMRIYPESSDNLGAGVDTVMSTNLATTEMIKFTGKDNINWKGSRSTYVT